MHSITQVIEELRKLKGYIEKETGEPSNIVGVGLASRKHLCINPEVRTLNCQIKDRPNSLWSLRPLCQSKPHQASQEEKYAAQIYDCIEFMSLTR